MSSFDPVVLFFILGVIVGISKSDLKIPDSFYNILSIYLLLSIGIKGGIELYKTGRYENGCSGCQSHLLSDSRFGNYIPLQYHRRY
ncbi:MAG: sodium-dependent bicarbonate transport family permease [Bacteroidetes bacterium]|nr:sodium-dependent bicarbonate transport family permease [Bacteroidota bacterium]MBL0064716.1 sodium-dependent bicarbonate transport family permease [Bacteroidota bacterium]MBL0137327.1 sodium-dependent bicarbonate transport family permease [Bacteroidota bacterium]